METLKKCPFCGGEAEVFHSNRSITSGHFVECTECGAKTNFGYNSIEYAIAAWNTRKPMERIVERLEELRDEHVQREEDARRAGLTRHADLNGVKAYLIEGIIEIVKEEGEV